MRIAFLTNILTPYRVHFFDMLHETVKKSDDDLAVFVMTESLPLRPWTYEGLKREYTHLLDGKRIDIGSNDYLFNPKVVKNILAFQPDALVVAGSWTYPTVCQAIFSKKLKKQCAIFFWTESHDHTGLQNASKTKSVIRYIKKTILKQFDGFCIPGKFARENIEQYISLDDAAVVRLPNLVDNAFYMQANVMRQNKTALRREKGIAEQTRVFFTPARLVDLKGQVPFFKNVAKILANTDTLFVLAGDGPDKQQLQDLADTHGINLHLVGYQTQAEVREWQALADAFLLPSLSDPNPLTNIEAAWSGLPLCVSCYVGNGPELVEDGVNGVVFDTLDEDSVTEKMNFVMHQSEEWFRLAGERSLAKAQQDFCSEIEANKYLVGMKQAVKHLRN